MRSSRFALLAGIFSALFAVNTTIAADVSIKPGDQVIQVFVQNDAQLKALEALKVDIWSHEYGIGPIDVHASAEQRAAITDLGMRFDVLDPDLLNTYAAERADIMLNSGLATPFDSYLNINDMYQFMTNLAIARPDLVEELPPIGLSIELRPIRVWHITGPDKSTKPGVFYHALQHCREWLTGPVILYFADRLVNGYDTDPAIQNLVNRVDFYLMPVANPDGYTYTWIDSTTRYWRKNRRNNGNGTFGVDLNRNWSHGWGGAGSSGVTSDETYRGPSPFSEPETQAYSNFILSHPNIRGYMDYHSYSQLTMWAYGEFCNTLSEPDYSAYYELGLMYHKKVIEATGLFYEPGPICQTIYQADGTSVDWTYGTAGRMALTTEVRPLTGSGNAGFSPGASQILPACLENYPGLMAETEWSTAGVVILVKDPPPVAQTGSVTPVKFKIYNSAETYVPGSASLYYRFGASGPYSSVVASSLGGVNYSADLPSAPCGTTIEYYVEAQGAGGYLGHAPNNFAVSNPEPNTYTAMSVQTIAIEDHFQTNLGWTASVVGATAGQWQRGTPVNDLATSYDPISDNDGSGQCYMTQNGAGSNTDVDNGTVVLTSPTLNLSGGDVRISYDYFLYLSNETGFVDRMLVEIDSNNGAGPWKQIALHATSGGVSWRRVSIDQSVLNSAGVTLTSTMKIRFSVNDANPQSTVEAAVDNVRVSVGTCSVVPCPGIPGDMNNNGTVDGDDVQGFVNANIVSPFFNSCADLAAPIGVLDNADASAFVAILLGP